MSGSGIKRFSWPVKRSAEGPDPRHRLIQIQDTPDWRRFNRTAAQGDPMSRGVPRKVKELLVKARDSAMLAVETYNRPTASFRVHAYIVLMQIAWTAALLAHFEKKRVKPYYRTRSGHRFVKAGDAPKRWDLNECTRRFWGDEASPVRKNLEFMIELRNRTEHSDLPELDSAVFGECQALLNNFEEFVTANFGEKWSLPHNLVVPLQLSGPPSPESLAALRRSTRPDRRKILDWIGTFRSTLADDVWQSERYSFRILLLPNVKNNPSRDALAIEFVKPEPGKENEFAQAVVVLKERRVPVVNEGGLKPSEVVDRVNAELPPPLKLTLNRHVRCWRRFDVRPAKGAREPWSTKGEYCRYDAVHKDYVYTDAWVNFLIGELSKPGRFDEVVAGTTSTPLVSGQGLPTAGATEAAMSQPSDPTLEARPDSHRARVGGNGVD